MGKNDFGTIIQIGDILVSEQIVTEFFACDYARCKGICCVEGDGGAPLKEEELDPLERNYEVYSTLMKPQGLSAVDQKGFFEIDRDGDIVTPLVEDSKECAYSFYDDSGNCFCSIERCFLAGKCFFRKPVSCWLYPIRVTKMPGGGEALNLHRWSICVDGYRKGREEGIRVYQFLKQPLIETYGKDFYDALCAAAQMINKV